MSSKRLRVLSYNIHKGFNFANRRFLLGEIRDSIRLVNADLVFLQEVVGENRKNHRRHRNWAPEQFEFLAEEMWPHYAYGRNAIYTHGHHGNAILSRFQFAAFDNIDVSIVPKSRRGILIGRIEGGVHVACVHFGLFGFERRRQILRLCALINESIPEREKLIIAGDFNDWRGDSHEMLTRELCVKEALLEKHKCLGKTFPARLPLLVMDRIYYRNLELADAEVLNGHPWKELSDHCAIRAEFTGAF